MVTRRQVRATALCQRGGCGFPGGTMIYQSETGDNRMVFAGETMLSRGLSRATAQALLKRAFLADVVSRIEVPELKRQLEQGLADALQDADDEQGVSSNGGDL